MEKTITAEQALHRIAGICKNSKDNVAKIQGLVNSAYERPTGHPQGPNVTMHKDIAEQISSALVEILDTTDKTITIA